MSQRSKFIMYTLIVGSLVTISAIIITVNKPDWKKTKPEPVNHQKMVEEYEKNAKTIMTEFSGLIASGNFTAEEIDRIKLELMRLTVPGEFRDLHASLVMAMNNIEDSFRPGSESLRPAGLKKIEQVKASCQWLGPQ